VLKAGLTAWQGPGGAVARAGAQAVEGDGYQPRAHVAFFGAFFGVFLGRIDRVGCAAAELLDQPGDVHGGGVGAQAAVAVRAGGDLRHAFHASPGGAAHPRGRLDLPGQRGQRAGAQFDAGRDVPGQAGPRVVGPQRFLGSRQCLFHRQDAQALEQFGLAAVPAVERADADPGAFGHGRYRSVRAHSGEDVPGRFQDGQVVAPRLGLATAARLRAQRAIRHVARLPPPCRYPEQNIPIGSNRIRTFR
jgi:hypothetical protein